MTRHSSEQVVGLCYRIDINNNLLPPTPADLAARAVRKRTRDIATTKKRNLEVMGTVEAGRVRKMRKRVGAAVRVVREEQKAEGIVDWGREVLTGGEEGAKFVIGRVVLHPLGVNVSPWNMDTVEFGKGLGMEESQEKWKRLLRQEVKAYGGYHRVMNMEDC